MRATLLLTCVLASAAAVASENENVRGIVISTPTDGREWGSDAMGPTLRDIRTLGAGWVAIHPYAAIRADGTVRFRDFDPESPPAYLRRPIEEAHALGLKILIKPHLAYWGSPFRWRGEIAFDTAEAWNRFFTGYERWIVKVAEACGDADGFVVATELDRSVHHEERWRRIIEKIRGKTGAPLTYAANWPDYRRVPFWDAVDVIGIQAYFPLTESSPPTDPEIEAAWRARMEELRAYSEEHNRKVVFTELGYNRSFSAAARPWDDRLDGPEAESIQAACLRIALRAVESEPSVVGVFLWKWFPSPRPVGRTFQLATPRLRRAISSVWK